MEGGERYDKINCGICISTIGKCFGTHGSIGTNHLTEPDCRADRDHNNPVRRTVNRFW